MDQAMTSPARSQARRINCGMRVHGVPENIVMASLAGHLHRHVSPGWYAAILFSDGTGLALGETDDVPEPAEHVIQWMGRVAMTLNRELHQGGHWIVAWSDSLEPVLLWRDGDGDLHVAVEVAVKADKLDAYGLDRVVQFAAEAQAEGRIRLGLLALSQGQIVKRALGQRAN